MKSSSFLGFISKCIITFCIAFLLFVVQNGTSFQIILILLCAISNCILSTANLLAISNGNFLLYLPDKDETGINHGKSVRYYIVLFKFITINLLFHISLYN